MGLVCLLAFGLYGMFYILTFTVSSSVCVNQCDIEWKGRDDGLVAHVFFRNGPNFALSVFAFAVEG